MNIFRTILTTLAVAMSLNACASKAEQGNAAGQAQNEKSMKSVIIYFTHSGNTELAAKEVAAATGAPMVRLLPEQPYSSEDVNWTNEQSRCTQEHLNQTLRPAIRPVDVNFAEVDTVFIGFPIWWHEEPAVIRAFLDNYREQLKGKVLYPFCTSYESPMSEADATLHKGYPDYNWKKGLRLPATPEQIKAWIEE